MTPRSRSACPRHSSIPTLLMRIGAGLLVALALALGPAALAPRALAQDAPTVPPPSVGTPSTDATEEPSTLGDEDGGAPADTTDEPTDEPTDAPADDQTDTPTDDADAPSTDDATDATRDTADDAGSDAGSDARDGTDADPDPARSEPTDSDPADGTPTDASPTDAEPADAEPAGVDPAATEPADTPAQDGDALEASDAAAAAVVALDGTDLVATRGDAELWRRTLRPEAGPVVGPIRDGDTIYVAHGLYLLTLDVGTGTVQARSALPASATELAMDGGRLTVEVDHGPAGREIVLAPQGRPEGPVRFGTDVDAMRGLARAARASADPVVAAGHDPTDPWLALQAARLAELDEGREDWLDLALDAGLALPFFEQLTLADALLSLDATDRAAQLYESALRDLAARGYDPRLATDAGLRLGYGFPEARLRDALEAGDLGRALLVAPYAWRLAAEEAPASVRVLHDLADALRDASPDALPGAAMDASPRDLARTWRDRARALDRSGLDAWVDALALRLGALGWWGVAALLGAFVLLWWVLLAKVWRAQSLARKQLKERDQAPPAVTRLWVPRHASTTEKLALLALMVLAGLQAALAGWHQDVEDPALALRSGTFASVEAIAALDALPDTPRAAWARGVSLAQRGELDAARAAWRDAGDLAPALTNRAVAQGGEEALFEAALAADPREPVARFRTGRAEDPSPFHATTVPDAALWAVPSPLEVRLASAGDWGAALTTALTAPWTALGDARPRSFPGWAAWTLAIAYGLLAVGLAVFVLIPRPRVSRDAPRTFSYQLGALLVPGSGHADELWGLLLLAPWALIGADALLAVVNGAGPLGLSSTAHAWTLGALWAVNAVGFSVELASYRHRMRLLREQKPELARSYGLPPAPRPEV